MPDRVGVTPGRSVERAQTLYRVRTKALRVTSAERDRDAAIREAFAQSNRKRYGYTVDDIAEAAGLSRARVYQIVKEAGE